MYRRDNVSNISDNVSCHMHDSKVPDDDSLTQLLREGEH
jgi:hypothetical protein